MLSGACRNAAVRVAEVRISSVTREDNDLQFMTYAGCWFKRTLAGYLVNITHEFGGPAISNLIGSLDSNLE